MKKRASEEKLEKLLVGFTENLAEKADGAEEIDSLSTETGDASSLFDTVLTISSVIQAKQPPKEFSARLSQVVRARFQEQIAAEKIRRIIDKATSDETFRKSFFRDMVAACGSIGLSLTPQEMAALRELKEDSVEEFANSLDERISKFFPTSLP